MEYFPVCPPWDKPFKEMTRSEARVYHHWFVCHIRGRLAMLERALGTTPGYEYWVPDFTSESLLSLSQWAYEHVTTRDKTPDELAPLRGAPEWVQEIGVPDWTLTYESLSIGWDLGIYLGEVLRHNLPDAEWVLAKTRGKTMAVYNQTILETPIAKVGFHPTSVGNVLVLGYAGLWRGEYSERHEPGHVSKTYGHWHTVLSNADGRWTR